MKINMKVSIATLFVVATTIIFFQNCGPDFKSSSQSSVSTGKSGTGHGYDGKVYVFKDQENLCTVAGEVNSKILYDKETDLAWLIWDNCESVDPIQLPSEEILISASSLIYSEKTFLFDPCESLPSAEPGTVCAGGGIYAGAFQYGGSIGDLNIMVTPGNCTNSNEPACDGNADTLRLPFGVDGINTQTENEKNGASHTEYLASTYPDAQAAQYCYNLKFGGYDDWYLPAVDELAFLLDEDRATKLGGFQGHVDFYWSSTSDEIDRAKARRNGGKSEINKSELKFVRCIRQL